MEKTEKRTCVNCRYYQYQNGIAGGWCHRKNLRTDKVSGQIYHPTAEYFRAFVIWPFSKNRCGPKGKFWEKSAPAITQVTLTPLPNPSFFAGALKGPATYLGITILDDRRKEIEKLLMSSSGFTEPDAKALTKEIVSIIERVT